MKYRRISAKELFEARPERGRKVWTETAFKNAFYRELFKKLGVKKVPKTFVEKEI